MLEFVKPKIKLIEEDKETHYGKFVCEPLERGYGTTLGNALRRTMLSSLPGAAITGIKIEGIQHEFTSIPNIVEDVVEIILNLKDIRFRKYGQEPLNLELKFKGAGEITAKDIKEVAGIEIINKDQHIATASSGADLNMSILVENGRGYNTVEDNEKENVDINFLPIDSIFTPISKVNYKVSPTRVGNKFDYDKLELEIWTDGSLTASDALSVASRVLITHFELFNDLSEFNESMSIMSEPVKDEKGKLLTTPITDLGFTKRPLNCLRIQSIETLGELLSYKRSEVKKFKNLGSKSMEEIEAKLAELKLDFKPENED